MIKGIFTILLNKLKYNTTHSSICIHLYKHANSLLDKKTPEERSTIIASTLSTSLLELSILYRLIELRQLNLCYIILFLIIFIFYILIFSWVSLYEFILLKTADFVIYTVKDGDTLLSISNEHFPECNPWKTSEVIMKKNNTKFISTGEKLLIPIKKEGETFKISFLHQHNSLKD